MACQYVIAVKVLMDGMIQFQSSVTTPLMANSPKAITGIIKQFLALQKCRLVCSIVVKYSILRTDNSICFANVSPHILFG